MPARVCFTGAAFAFHVPSPSCLQPKRSVLGFQGRLSREPLARFSSTKIHLATSHPPIKNLPRLLTLDQPLLLFRSHKYPPSRSPFPAPSLSTNTPSSYSLRQLTALYPVAFPLGSAFLSSVLSHTPSKIRSFVKSAISLVKPTPSNGLQKSRLQKDARLGNFSRYIARNA